MTAAGQSLEHPELKATQKNGQRANLWGLHAWGYKTGKMVGEEITLIGVYGDISRLPTGEVEQMGGVESLIPISRAYKRAAQKGVLGNLIHHTVCIGNVEVGGDELTVIAGPCSVESEAQIMEAARMVKEAGAQALRGGVVKYRSSPYSGWEGIGSSSGEALRNGLKLIVQAGKEFKVLGRNKLGEMSLATPALAGGSLFLRTQTKLWCLRAAEKK